MTFIYLHGVMVKTCGDEFELEGRNVAACRHIGYVGAEMVIVTYRSIALSLEPAAVRCVSPFTFTAAVPARTDCPSAHLISRHR